MKRVLILGSGFVGPPLVRYLLTRSRVHVRVASDDPARARAMVGNHQRGEVVRIDARDAAAVDACLRESDLVVSLLPAPLHPRIAQLAVARRVPMITTSYVSPAMRELDGPARAAGVLLLNEMGLDPGIDHMSAMSVLDRVARSGKTLTQFSSCCGGLPAPEANDNPWGYKFSWSPRGALVAARSSARYRCDGRTVEIPAGELFRWRFPVSLPGLGEFEVYPNRDSLPYADLYKIPHAQGVFRGTYRWPGWCETLSAVSRLGLLDESELAWPAGTTWARLTTRHLPGTFGPVRDRVARALGLAKDHPVLHRLEWAGLLAELPLPRAFASPIDLLCERLAVRLSYAPGERDMVVLRHDFAAARPDGATEHVVSHLTAYGDPGGHSAMATTVSLPAAIAARLILEGRYGGEGVAIPVDPELYRPVLEELSHHGVRFRETSRVVAAEPARRRRAKESGR